jgi:hypothetical protein
VAEHDGKPPPIPEGARLWRRVPKRHWIDDETGNGTFRPSSAAFEDDGDGDPMSTTLVAESTIAQCLDPVRHMDEPFAVAEFPAAVAIEKGLTLRRDPTADEPAHIVVEGKKTKATRNALVRASTWAWPPPGKPYPLLEVKVSADAGDSAPADEPDVPVRKTWIWIAAASLLAVLVCAALWWFRS